jgi:tetratricopeptide (TPR) repeat protein
MRRPIIRLMTVWLAISLPVEAAAKKKQKTTHSKQNQAEEKTLDLNKMTFKEILERYVFIADFNQKPADRPITKEVVWKYPFKLPPVNFDLDLDTVDLDAMVFPVHGQGRDIERINVGRVAFLAGNHQEAYDIWLTARQVFKDNVATNKILEFFMGVNALAIYKKEAKLPHLDPNRLAPKAYIQRAAYFFAATFILRKDVPDERIDKHASWALYNLAVFYYMFERFPSVFGAADMGLASLLKEGKKEHRAEFRRLLAECYIRNQDLISAIQELDTAIRQDPDPIQAAKMFSRVGDIYYDLNNYELAEDMYAMAGAIDRESKNYSPAQALLKAESIFWLGRVSEAENIFRIAASNALEVQGDGWLMESKTIPWALLRVGDALLIRAQNEKEKKKKELLDKARLAYFQVQSAFPKSEAARIADVRGACLEMPTYQGNNVPHARSLFADVKEKKDVPENLMELVWACDAGSYSDREKTDLMVSKIKEFSDKYPSSRYLDAMLAPVKDVQASKIEEYFAKDQWEAATEFFEQRRELLFPKISVDLATKLWTAYVETGRSSKALEFWPKARGQKRATDLEHLRQAAFLFEVVSTKAGGKSGNDLASVNKTLMDIEWDEKPSQIEMDYLSRILVSRDVAIGYPWILNLQDAWTASDEGASCSVLFPFLSRINSDPKSPAKARSEVVRRTNEFGESKIADVKSKDPTCFQSWLDFESKVVGEKALESIYDKRADWVVEGPWLDRLWTWSESLYARGRRPDAVKIWQKIVDKAPKDSFEFRMAKSRLDPLKTEYEALWK